MAGGWKTDYARYRGYFQNAITTAQKKQDVKMFLEILLTLTTIIIFVSLALRPTLITISELVKDIDSKQDVIDQMDVKLSSLRQAQTLLDQEARKIALLDTAVPTQPEPDKFAVQVEGAAAYNQTQFMGLSIDELVLLGKDKKVARSQDAQNLPQGANGIVFSFNNQGEFFNLQNLISYLENMRRPIQIDTLNINRSVTELAEFISITITGQAPYLRGLPETNTK